MPTAVLDLDLANFPNTDIDLPTYTKAFILIRYKGLPIGKTQITISEKLSIKSCYDQLMAAVEKNYWEHWINDYLDWDERRVRNSPQLKATIAICTRNRTDDLAKCLHALSKLPDDGQEILVIDNCPSDNSTALLVETFPQVRYVLEPNPGLDNARNRALLEAKNEVVAFIDDDAVPDGSWLRALIANFNSANVMCVTGLTMPLELETEAQEQFERYSSFSKGFRRKVFTFRTCNPVATGSVGAGANMAFRKSVMQKVGLFDEGLDAGTPTHSGGDHEMFMRILMAGYHIVYDPAALNWHRHRRTKEELRQVIYGYGVGVYSIFTHHLVTNYEFSVLGLAFRWFWKTQFPKLRKALLKKHGAPPLELITAELRGCIAGPSAYLKSRKKTRLLLNKKTP
jgi:GT2 family glycosyltransferase